MRRSSSASARVFSIAASSCPRVCCKCIFGVCVRAWGCWCPGVATPPHSLPFKHTHTHTHTHTHNRKQTRKQTNKQANKVINQTCSAKNSLRDFDFETLPEVSRRRSRPRFRRGVEGDDKASTEPRRDVTADAGAPASTAAARAAAASDAAASAALARESDARRSDLSDTIYAADATRFKP